MRGRAEVVRGHAGVMRGRARVVRGHARVVRGYKFIVKYVHITKSKTLIHIKPKHFNQLLSMLSLY